MHKSDQSTVLAFSSKRADAIRLELASILQSESFAGSKRCRDFLEFVVLRTLDGDEASLTERFLGAALFGRPVDYETATDSIVRVRANDVRRRLTEYYSSPQLPAAVRIEMVAGCYVPAFHWLSLSANVREEIPRLPEMGKPVSLDAGDSPIDLQENSHVVPQAPRPPWQYFSIWILAFTVLLIGATVIYRSAGHHGQLEAFWQPIVETPGQPVLNLPTTDTFQLLHNAERSVDALKALQPGQSIRLENGDFLTFHDWHVSLPVMQAAMSVAMMLDRRGKMPLIRIGTDLRRDELRGHAIIAIGSFSNPWAEEAVNGLRFTFDRGPSNHEAPRIRDAQNPARTWSLPSTFPNPQNKDYAIITRTFDPGTHVPFLSLSGLHSFGNQIAGEFIAQESSWEQVAKRAPSGWQTMNLQVLLEADVIGTTPGTPRIVDAYFWK